MAKEPIVFIINPRSGSNTKKDIPTLIRENLNTDLFEPLIWFTEARAHGTELAVKALNQGIKKIIAVGGDGTINEIAGKLLNTDAALGIIPRGSGNGLARHLKIPLDTVKAIQLLNNSRVLKMDSGNVNGKPFFCTSGVGFDAHIGKLFADKVKRGFQTYITTTISEFFNYTPAAYHLLIDGKRSERKAFFITFANTSQYGNDAFICPDADVEDGMLDVCILKPFPKYTVLDIGRRLFSKSIQGSKYMERIKIREIVIETDHEAIMHLDGEPFIAGKVLEIKVMPGSLNVLVAN
jgi:YegS/Rv2252/BmrU family lipid kinase